MITISTIKLTCHPVRGGLLGESERKNISQMANNSIGVVSNRLHHFIADSPWKPTQINQRRLEIINKRSQTFVSPNKFFFNISP